MWRADFARREHESSSDKMALLEDESSDIGDVIDERELKTKVAAVISTLSEEQQQIVDLKFYQELNDTEISRELGITRQAVQNRVAKILAKIKKKF
jgi:RNA polymerase sigma factor (sigma-70 family)